MTTKIDGTKPSGYRRDELSDISKEHLKKIFEYFVPQKVSKKLKTIIITGT